MAAILPLAETVAIGGLDGLVRTVDVKQGRTTVVKQWSTWLEAGLIGLGAIGAMRRMHPDYWEPPLLLGLGFLSQRGGAYVGHVANIGTSNPGYGGPGDYAGGPMQPAGVLGGPAPARAALPAAYVRRTQPTGVFG